MRCNCESSYCAHAWRPCPTPADGTVRMDYVGDVCHTCAQVTIANGGASLIHLAPDVDALTLELPSVS